jgi:carbon storage regulator
MLVLSIKVQEVIVIDGRIRIKVVRVDGETVKIGIEAPSDVPVHREEVYLEIQKNNQAALAGGKMPVPKLQERSPGSRQAAPNAAPHNLSQPTPL